MVKQENIQKTVIDLWPELLFMGLIMKTNWYHPKRQVSEREIQKAGSGEELIKSSRRWGYSRTFWRKGMDRYWQNNIDSTKEMVGTLKLILYIDLARL